MGYESQHLLHAVEAAKIPRWVSMSEGKGQSFGWLTTNERKEQMCLLLREALTVGKVAFSSAFFSTELGVATAKRELKDELETYSVLVEPPKTTFGKTRKTYTGKVSGKQDDLCIALQLSIIAQSKFFQDPRYASFRRPDSWASVSGMSARDSSVPVHLQSLRDSSRDEERFGVGAAVERARAAEAAAAKRGSGWTR